MTRRASRRVAGAGAKLSEFILNHPKLVFEGHSTDYQTRHKLREMVEDGVKILKVGPALTFALREALCALEYMEKVLYKGENIWLSNFSDTLETAMLKNPGNWVKHYDADMISQGFSRRYGFLDRSRYYLPEESVAAAINRLTINLSEGIPFPLLSQYMPMQYAKVREGLISNDVHSLIKSRIGDYIDDYLFAIL